MRTATPSLSTRRPLPPLLIPAFFAGGAVAAIGWWSDAAAALIVGLPVIGAMASGIATRRGLLIGGVVILLGMTLVDAPSQSVTSGNLWLLSGLVATAMVAGWQIESQIPRSARIASTNGVWMTVVVEAGCPPGDAALTGSPIPFPPLDDPERRSLHRRKNRYRTLEAAGRD